MWYNEFAKRFKQMRLLTQDILICNELKYMIENTPILEGEKLPSQRELAHLLDVQRPTVRTGLKLLLQEGWIYAKERSGYFVSPKRITKNVSQLSSTTKMVLSMGKEMRLSVLKIERREVDKELSLKIKLPIGTKIFYMIRLRVVEEEKVSVEVSYIPVSIAPTLDECDFSKKSLYGILEDDFLIDLDHARQSISVELANEEIASYLGIEVDTKLVVEEGLVYSKDKKPVEYSLSYMILNRFVYENM